MRRIFPNHFLNVQKKGNATPTQIPFEISSGKLLRIHQEKKTGPTSNKGQAPQVIQIQLLPPPIPAAPYYPAHNVAPGSSSGPGSSRNAPAAAFQHPSSDGPEEDYRLFPYIKAFLTELDQEITGQDYRNFSKHAAKLIEQHGFIRIHEIVDQYRGEENGQFLIRDLGLEMNIGTANLLLKKMQKRVKNIRKAGRPFPDSEW